MRQSLNKQTKQIATFTRSMTMFYDYQIHSSQPQSSTNQTLYDGRFTQNLAVIKHP